MVKTFFCTIKKYCCVERKGIASYRKGIALIRKGVASGFCQLTGKKTDKLVWFVEAESISAPKMVDIKKADMESAPTGRGGMG